LARFLLAHLHLKSLIGKISIKTVRTALKILPTGSEAAYDQAYEDVMKRIEGQITDQKKLAERVLSWITCAKRPLTTPELQYALAIETNASKLDEDNLSQVEDIVSVCAGLVTVDDESDIIRLVHYTAQQYFERTQKRWFPNAQSEITRICVTYLSFNAFDKGFCQTDEDFEDRLRSNPLYDYAAHNWGHHARDDESPCQTVLDFLKCEKHVEASMQALMAVKKWSGHSEYSQNIPRNITGLHLASYFGLDKVVTQLISDGYGPDFKDSYDSTPLSWAAANGHKATVKLLLDTGKVEADSKDKNSQTPLLLAAKRGQVAIVKLLLDIDKVDGYSKNNKAFVKKLLATSKVNVNAKDRFNRTPLSHAAQNGYEAVVKLLLDTSKVDVDAKDRDGRTPLLYAAEKGREAVIKLLLDTGKVDVDAKNCDGCTPFTWASKNGHEAVVKLLNTTGKVNIDVENNWGRTPLSYKLLLDNGADLESKDKLHGRTPLSYAAENGHEAVVKLLFSQGADVAAKDNSGGTALRLAAENGHKGIMKLLVEQGADNVVVA
jgi:ankyrin repeat protein